MLDSMAKPAIAIRGLEGSANWQEKDKRAAKKSTDRDIIDENILYILICRSDSYFNYRIGLIHLKRRKVDLQAKLCTLFVRQLFSRIIMQNAFDFNGHFFKMNDFYRRIQYMDVNDIPFSCRDILIFWCKRSF